MSTDTQSKGDSQRRQLKASRDYAVRHGLILVEGDELQDIGVSAFKGANQKDGALGRFLAAAKEGRIEPGSFLLVESLDRLSRQEVLEALSLFLSIVQAGIVLVTLNDGQVYRKEKTGLPELMLSLMSMSRAHEESRTKSQRVAAAWKNKRAHANQKPMTKICPAWLRLSADRTGYEAIPDRIAVVKSIFEEAANGIGIYSIARRLNQQAIPTFNKSNGWHMSYISKILNNRAAIGEFQPHNKADGVRKPDGEPIQNYFPPVISEEIFYKAKAGRSIRAKVGRGRKGEFVSNVFSGLLRCAYCHSSMKFENKGQPPKGGQYLVCERGKRHLGCVTVRWKYEDFEQSFLAFVSEIDLASVVQGANDRTEAQDAESEIAVIEGRIAEVGSQQERAFVLYQAGGEIEFVSEKLKQYQADLRDLEAKLLDKTNALQELRAAQNAFEQSKAEIKALIERVRAGSAESYSLRSMLSARLRSLIEQVLVASRGRIPTIERTIDALKAGTGDDWGDVVSHLTASLDETMNARPYFTVGFKDGSVRAVTPNPQSPLEYEEQIISKEGEMMLETPLGATTGFGAGLPSDWWEKADSGLQ